MDPESYHLTSEAVNSVVEREAAGERAIELFHHWKDCTECQQKLWSKNTLNPVFNNSQSTRSEPEWKKRFNIDKFEFTVTFRRDQIYTINIDRSNKKERKQKTKPTKNPTRSLYAYLENYIQGRKVTFNNFDSNCINTVFQKEVLFWTSLIPYGRTVNYGKIARWMDKKCYRAVGQALHKNPLPILIPCHRVIGKNGSLTGFASGVDTKRKLLEIEQVINI